MWLWDDSFICELIKINMIDNYNCDIIHSHDSFPWLIQMWINQLWINHVTHMKGSWHADEWIMLHIWMGHVTRINGSCDENERVMSHTRIRRVIRMNDSYRTWINESCHTYECHTHDSVLSAVLHSQLTHINGSCHTCQWFTWHVWMGLDTHINGSCHTYQWFTWHVWMGLDTHK